MIYGRAGGVGSVPAGRCPAKPKIVGQIVLLGAREHVVFGRR